MLSLTMTDSQHEKVKKIYERRAKAEAGLNRYQLNRNCRQRRKQGTRWTFG